MILDRGAAFVNHSACVLLLCAKNVRAKHEALIFRAVMRRKVDHDPPDPPSPDRCRFDVIVNEWHVFLEVVAEHRHQLFGLRVVGCFVGPCIARVQ